MPTKVVKFTMSIYYSNNALSEQVISWEKTGVTNICYCPFLYQKYQDSFTKAVLCFLITAPSYTIYQRMTHRNQEQCHEKNPCMQKNLSLTKNNTETMHKKAITN